MDRTRTAFEAAPRSESDALTHHDVCQVLSTTLQDQKGEARNVKSPAIAKENEERRASASSDHMTASSCSLPTQCPLLAGDGEQARRKHDVKQKLKPGTKRQNDVQLAPGATQTHDPALPSQSQLVQPPLVLRGWPLFPRLQASKRDRKSNSGSGDADESDISDDDDDNDEDEDEDENARASKSSRFSLADWRGSARSGGNVDGGARTKPAERTVCASAVAPLKLSLSSQLDEQRAGATGEATSDVASAKATKTGNKTSRYLREMDRRDILTRIGQGEKQAALAKEYNISRSAVCNLHKKRQQVLARAHASPFAKHPKVSRSAANRPIDTDMSLLTPSVHDGFNPSSTNDGASIVDDTSDGGLYRLTSRAAAVLLRALVDLATRATDFRRFSDRLLRLVLEEALALLQMTHPIADLSLINGPPSDDGATLVRSSCAISLKQRGCAMLDQFTLLEPEQPTGYARIASSSAAAAAKNGEEANQLERVVSIVWTNLPTDLSQHDVLLLEAVVENGDLVCHVVDKLVALSASSGGGSAMCESQIVLAALFVSNEAIETIARFHPRVRVVTVASNEFAVNAASFRTRFERETGKD